MIPEAAWLAGAAGECSLLMELKADPNDAADAWVSRSLHGLMDLPAYRATALGRAAAKYVHDRLIRDEMQSQPGAACIIACILGWIFIRSTLPRNCRGASTYGHGNRTSSLMAPRSLWQSCCRIHLAAV